MSGRRLNQPAKGLRREIIELEGTIQILSNATVDTTNSDMVGFTAARTSAGVYTITLTDPYASVASVNLTLGAAVAVDLVPQLVSQSTTTIVFRTNTGAVATDPAAACFVGVRMRLHNSPLKV